VTEAEPKELLMTRRTTVLLTILTVLLVPLVVSCGAKKQVPPPPPTEREEAPREVTKPVPQEIPAEKPAPVEEFGDINFDYDRFSLSTTAQKILTEHAKLLSENKTWTVRIEGHCDERGTVEYNLALGEKRANAARVFLVQYGVPAENISTVSYGKERPKDMRANEAGWAVNRRDEFHVTR
jgi:peptidoglycan-associated lipoprotein